MVITGPGLSNAFVFFRKKAQCLMASKTRIDERSTLRMYVFEKEKNPTTGNYHGRPMKVCEREALMGYSKGYVEEPGE